MRDNNREVTLLKFTQHWEGGGVDDPLDKGKKTNFGISSAANPDIDLDNLTPSSAGQVLLDRYYYAPQYFRLPPRTGQAAFDWAVTSGPNRVTRKLQSILGVTADGKLGPITAEHALLTDEDALLRAFLNKREAFYKAIVADHPDQGKFLNGWLNRVRDMRRTLGVLDA